MSTIDLSRARLGAAIGRGGAGEVIEAEHPTLGNVALKIAHPALAADPREVARARTEATALARVQHANVLRVMGTSTTADGRFALVVPRLVGRTLRAVLDARRRLPWVLAARLGASVLDGLEAAHRAGVIHRDVKPSNVFIGRERGEPASAARPIVIDFGLARLDGAASPATTASSVVGSPAYVAPGQVLAGAQDARTDVYGASVVIFEAIAGGPPFAGADPARVLEAHLVDEPPDLLDRALVPRELAACLARGLAKSPRDRFSSAAEMATALRRCVARACAPASWRRR
jgi:serine/threonine protein kinase